MASSKCIIPDASVLIKWFRSSESNSNEATQLQKDFLNGKCSLHMPALSLWELGNFIGRHYKQEDATGIMSHLLGMKIPTHHIGLTLASIGFEIMNGSKAISFYDASYHALAIHLNGIFVTSDRKYFAQTKEWGHIQLLKDYR